MLLKALKNFSELNYFKKQDEKCISSFLRLVLSKLNFISLFNIFKLIGKKRAFNTVQINHLSQLLLKKQIAHFNSPAPKKLFFTSLRVDLPLNERMIVNHSELLTDCVILFLKMNFKGYLVIYVFVIKNKGSPMYLLWE